MEEVRNWLRGFGLLQYSRRFREDGWDTLQDLLDIDDDDDLKNCINKPGHRKRFYLAVTESRAVANESTISIRTDEPSEINISDESEKVIIHPHTKYVETWLQKHGLEQYTSKLKEEGWDIPEVLLDMDDENIKACIDKPGHRTKFQLALKGGEFYEIRSLISQGHISAEDDFSEKGKDIKEWLKSNCLEQYIQKFDEDGWDTLDVVFDITEEDLKRCIDKPGHRKRFQKAVKETKSNNLLTEASTIGDHGDVRTNKDTEMDISSPHVNTEYQQYPDTVEQNRNTCTCTSFDNRQGDQLNKRQNERDVEEDKVTKTVIPGSPDDQSECERRNDTDVTLCPDDSVEDGVLETLVGNQKQEQDEPVEKKMQVPPVRFGLDSDENESKSSSDTDEKRDDMVENIDDFDETQPGFTPVTSSSEDNEEKQLAEARNKDKKRHPERLKRTFSMPPSLICYKPSNISVGGLFETYNVPVAEKRKKRDNFKKQMKTALDSYKEKDSLYVETKAFRELEHIVEASHWAVITGVPGDGKTAMAAHLSLKFNKKGYEHLELHFARDWKDWVDGSSGKNQFILIDDIFGRMSIDERKVSEWSSIVDLMQRVVKQRAGSLIVVCTSRKYVFNDVKTKLAQFSSFQRSSVVDMTEGDFALTTAEKISIWTKYAEKYTVKTEMPECINRDTKTPHGFPHCVDLFATNIFLQNKGVSFFENPMEYVCREINNFKENDRIKYCVLLIVLFNNNKLTETTLEEIASNPSKIDPIASASGLNCPPRTIDLKNALDGLRNTYISESDNCYSISHDSIRENLAFMLIKENPRNAIDRMDFEYLTDHTRCHGQNADDESKIYVLNPRYNKQLAERMINEIKNGNVVTVCAHQAWNSSEFIAEFMNAVLPKSESNGDDLVACKRTISDIFNTKDSSTSYIFDFSLSDALRFFGHRDAVKQIWEYKSLEELLKQSQDVVEIPPDLCFDRKLSQHLCRVMDDIGASKSSREFQIDSALSMEILDTLCTYIANQKFSCYIFGSHSEGTRIRTHIPKLESDVNYLFCRYDREVIQNISEVRGTKNIEYLLTVTDEIAKPGYVKLQIVQDGIPQTKTHSGDQLPSDTMHDYKDRLVVYKKRPDKIHVDEVSGAAATTEIVTGHDFEICHSYRCRTWPDVATKWLNRIRHQNWPSRYAIEHMKSLGIFLVPVGYPGSIEKRLEWKMSFLLQERMLMSTLNDTQYKCYIILKMINNDIISYMVKEPVLVSYHLKTCMFYVVENTPNDFWKPENLLDCVQLCLKCILQWTVEGICPNYFIPEENLFYRRIHGELQTKLRNVLSILLSSTFNYFPKIKCGNLGPRLEQIITHKPGHVVPGNDLVPDKVRLYLKAVKFIALVKVRILCKCSCDELVECVSSHFTAVTKLRKVDITEHSKEQIKKAISLVSPYVELSLMANLIVIERKLTEDDSLLKQLLLSQSWHEVSILSDQFSAKLKQATFLYMLGHSDASLAILQSLNISCGHSMISVCGCKYHHIIVDDVTRDEAKDMSEPEFRKQYCMPCVVFLPTERDLIPDVLIYEMKRSNERSSVSETTPYHFWYEWAVVDSKVLMYLLLHLNHAQLKMAKESEDDTEMLESVIQKDVNLGHKETGLNILGWIYRREGKEVKAIDCFQDSLKLQWTYNAANLHMKESHVQ